MKYQQPNVQILLRYMGIVFKFNIQLIGLKATQEMRKCISRCVWQVMEVRT